MGDHHRRKAAVILLLMFFLQAAAVFAAQVCPIDKIPTEVRISHSRAPRNLAMGQTDNKIIIALSLIAQDTSGKTTSISGSNLSVTVTIPVADSSGRTIQTNVIDSQQMTTDSFGQITFEVKTGNFDPRKIQYTISAIYVPEPRSVYIGSGDSESYTPAAISPASLSACFPFFLVAGLLMAALYAAGKDPFGFFDFSRAAIRPPPIRARQPKLISVSTDVAGLAKTALHVKELSAAVKAAKAATKESVAQAEAAKQKAIAAAKIQGSKGILPSMKASMAGRREYRRVMLSKSTKEKAQAAAARALAGPQAAEKPASSKRLGPILAGVAGAAAFAARVGRKAIGKPSEKDIQKAQEKAAKKLGRPLDEAERAAIAGEARRNVRPLFNSQGKGRIALLSVAFAPGLFGGDIKLDSPTAGPERVVRRGWIEQFKALNAMVRAMKADPKLAVARNMAAAATIMVATDRATKSLEKPGAKGATANEIARNRAAQNLAKQNISNPDKNVMAAQIAKELKNVTPVDILNLEIAKAMKNVTAKDLEKVTRADIMAQLKNTKPTVIREAARNVSTDEMIDQLRNVNKSDIARQARSNLISWEGLSPKDLSWRTSTRSMIVPGFGVIEIGGRTMAPRTESLETFLRYKPAGGKTPSGTEGQLAGWISAFHAGKLGKEMLEVANSDSRFNGSHSLEAAGKFALKGGNIAAGATNVDVGAGNKKNGTNFSIESNEKGFNATAKKYGIDAKLSDFIQNPTHRERLLQAASERPEIGGFQGLNRQFNLKGDGIDLVAFTSNKDYREQASKRLESTPNTDKMRLAVEALSLIHADASKQASLISIKTGVAVDFGKLVSDPKYQDEFMRTMRDNKVKEEVATSALSELRSIAKTFETRVQSEIQGPLGMRVDYVAFARNPTLHDEMRETLGPTNAESAMRELNQHVRFFDNLSEKVDELAGQRRIGKDVALAKLITDYIPPTSSVSKEDWDKLTEEIVRVNGLTPTTRNAVSDYMSSKDRDIQASLSEIASLREKYLDQMPKEASEQITKLTESINGLLRERDAATEIGKESDIRTARTYLGVVANYADQNREANLEIDLSHRQPRMVELEARLSTMPAGPERDEAARKIQEFHADTERMAQLAERADSTRHMESDLYYGAMAPLVATKEIGNLVESVYSTMTWKGAPGKALEGTPLEEDWKKLRAYAETARLSTMFTPEQAMDYLETNRAFNAKLHDPEIMKTIGANIKEIAEQEGIKFLPRSVDNLIARWTEASDKALDALPRPADFAGAARAEAAALGEIPLPEGKPEGKMRAIELNLEKHPESPLTPAAIQPSPTGRFSVPAAPQPAMQPPSETGRVEQVRRGGLAVEEAAAPKEQPPQQTQMDFAEIKGFNSLFKGTPLNEFTKTWNELVVDSNKLEEQLRKAPRPTVAEAERQELPPLPKFGEIAWRIETPTLPEEKPKKA